jgi:hypothetical protein
MFKPLSRGSHSLWRTEDSKPAHNYAVWEIRYALAEEHT